MAYVAAAGAVIGLLGTAMSTMGRVNQAEAQARAYELEAQSIEADATFDEQQQRRQGRLLKGSANATAAASGLDITSGSPLLLELDRVKQSEIEALSIRRKGQVDASARRYGADTTRRSTPYIIAGGAAEGASILTSYAGRRYTG